jgi:hypothetical protein
MDIIESLLAHPEADRKGTSFGPEFMKLNCEDNVRSGLVLGGIPPSLVEDVFHSSMLTRISRESAIPNSVREKWLCYKYA